MVTMLAASQEEEVSVHTHDLGRCAGGRVRWLPSPPPGPPDLDGRSVQHKLLALSQWSDELEVGGWLPTAHVVGWLGQDGAGSLIIMRPAVRPPLAAYKRTNNIVFCCGWPVLALCCAVLQCARGAVL
jgi:hypothetical protein